MNNYYTSLREAEPEFVYDIKFGQQTQEQIKCSVKAAIKESTKELKSIARETLSTDKPKRVIDKIREMDAQELATWVINLNPCKLCDYNIRDCQYVYEYPIHCYDIMQGYFESEAKESESNT